MKNSLTLNCRIIAAILILISSLIFSQQNDYLRFDFGSKKSPLEKYSVLIDSSSSYSKEKGFGLVTNGLSSYHDSYLEKITNQVTCDGLSSNDSIEFRVDIGPGDYIVEILMHGGERTIWEGSISINGNELSRRLLCYSANYEGQSPPPYWGLTKQIRNSNNQLVFKIKADKQLTKISGISVYSADFGPIRNIEGRAVAVEKLKAPNADFCLELINKAKIVEAKKIIDAIPMKYRFEKALLLFALSSRIEVQNPRDYIETAYYYLRDESEVNPRSEVLLNLRFAELILNANQFQNTAGWMWNKDEYPKSGFFNYVNIAGDSFEEASAIPEHPLFLCATWLKAKTAYWIFIEQHEKELVQLADKYFNLLKKYFPDNKLLDEYLALCKYDVRNESKPAATPQWAFLQKKIVSLMHEIIYHWVETRQAPNGEFGGKYDDDVEMLRWWPISRIVFNDSIALKGLKRIVDGIWNSDWIYKGFSKRVRDVEHSSEPVADTQPMMIGFDFGNPIYVERCMESVKGIRDLWTGINSKGHRHFKSSWYSSTQIDAEPPKDCDLEMNTRTVKAALWLAWYNRHPFVMQFLKEWGDAWLEDCLRTEKGKPEGVVPAAVRYSDDAIGGHENNWHHPNMFWDYFNYRGGAKMLKQLLITSILLNDAKYLKPIELSLQLIKKYENDDFKDVELGTERYAVNVMLKSDDFWEAIELWRLYNNNSQYDELIKKVGSPYIKYFLTKDDSELILQLQNIVNDMVNNFTLNTSEGYFTDRIDLGNMRTQDSPAGGIMEAMYLGSSLAEAEYPFNRISWNGFDKNFSALVMESNRNGIKLKTYIHSDKSVNGEINFLDFVPGDYTMEIGRDTDGDLMPDSDITKKSFSITERNSKTVITLRGNQEQTVEIKLERKSENNINNRLTDLAIVKDELSIVNKGNVAVISIPIHNIGIENAKDVYAELSYYDDGKITKLKSSELISIPAPLDLEVKKVTVSFEIAVKKGRYKIEVMSKNNIKEITQINNIIEFTL